MSKIMPSDQRYTDVARLVGSEVAIVAALHGNPTELPGRLMGMARIYGDDSGQAAVAVLRTSGGDLAIRLTEIIEVRADLQAARLGPDVPTGALAAAILRGER